MNISSDGFSKKKGTFGFFLSPEMPFALFLGSDAVGL
jgi:hypothetical protein